MPNEADTCRRLVVPKLQAVGWDDSPHSIAEQRSIAASILEKEQRITQIVGRIQGLLAKQEQVLP